MKKSVTFFLVIIGIVLYTLMATGILACTMWFLATVVAMLGGFPLFWCLLADKNSKFHRIDNVVAWMGVTLSPFILLMFLFDILSIPPWGSVYMTLPTHIASCFSLIVLPILVATRVMAKA